ncbi:MAG: glycosyltransferase family 4 protein, partial [Acidobacteriota bacterium]
VRALGISDRVEMVGPRPHDAVLEDLAWADILLHLSVSEGFGNAVLEAQAMAIPAVVSDADGLPENVADGETGFVVPRRDPDAAARRLAELVRNPELRLAMGRAGRCRVEHHFTPQAEISAFEDLYHRVLA